MEHNWSIGGSSSEAGGSYSSTHNPSSSTTYIDADGSSSSPCAGYPPYNYVPQHSDLLYITVPQVIQLTTVALHHTYMLHIPVIAVQVDILSSCLLNIFYIFNF